MASYTWKMANDKGTDVEAANFSAKFTANIATIKAYEHKSLIDYEKELEADTAPDPANPPAPVHLNMARKVFHAYLVTSEYKSPSFNTSSWDQCAMCDQGELKKFMCQDDSNLIYRGDYSKKLKRGFAYGVETEGNLHTYQGITSVKKSHINCYFAVYMPIVPSRIKTTLEILPGSEDAKPGIYMVKMNNISYT